MCQNVNRPRPPLLHLNTEAPTTNQQHNHIVLPLWFIGLKNILKNIFFPLQDEIVYRSTGEEDALKYFYVDPFTGRVTIKELLYPGTRMQYTVSLSVLSLIAFFIYSRGFFLIETELKVHYVTQFVTKRAGSTKCVPCTQNITPVKISSRQKV